MDRGLIEAVGVRHIPPQGKCLPDGAPASALNMILGVVDFKPVGRSLKISPAGGLTLPEAASTRKNAR